MTIDNTGLSCNSHPNRNEWWLGNLAARVCAGVHYVSQSQRMYSTMNGEASHWYHWQKHCRILGTKKLLLVFKHFEVIRAGVDDNYEYW